MINLNPDVSVIIPAYNEEGTINEVLSELLRLKNRFQSIEIIVVDDGSSDKTALIASKFSSVRLIKHKENMGKGVALKTGFKAANGKVIIVQDADMEYFPREILKLVKPILTGKADVVYGSRFRCKPLGMSCTHFLGNTILSTVASILYLRRITDIMTGHKAFSNKVLKSLNIREKGFSVEADFTVQILKNGWRFLEIPIDYKYRPKGVSKITNQDGIKSLIHLFAHII